MDTQYGFKWNNFEVERVCGHKKFGSILIIKTQQNIMNIRITPGGKIKVHTYCKNKIKDYKL